MEAKVLLADIVDNAMNQIEKRLIEVIKEKQGTKGYVDTQVSKGGVLSIIHTYYDDYCEEMVVVGVRVRNDMIEFIADPSNGKVIFSEKDFLNEKNWNGDFVNGEYLYYETIINIANAIEEF